jgi:hypothetical protein
MPRSTLKALVATVVLAAGMAAGELWGQRESASSSPNALPITAPSHDSPGTATSHASAPALVSGISIEPGANGEIQVDVATSRPVPYHFFKLGSPSRLVVDFDGTREGVRRQVFPADFSLLKRVRVGQWKAGHTSIVRVVADLSGHPQFQVISQPSGVRIRLERAATDTTSSETFRREGSASVNAAEPPGRRAQPALPGRPRQSLRAMSKGMGLRTKAQLLVGSVAGHPRPSARKQPRAALRSDHLASKIGPAVAPVEPVPDHSPFAFEPSQRPQGVEGPGAFATVSKIAIHPDRDGKTLVEVATTRSVPYHFFQLGRPPRLVVDLDNARRGLLPDSYPVVHSLVLRQVRVGQWKSPTPAIVRVVADLEGWPAFHVHPEPPGVQIDLAPREFVPRPIRNPFAYFSPRTIARRYQARALAQNEPPPVAAQLTPPPNLSYLGYVLMQGSQVEAIVADNLQIRMVRQGDTIEGRYQILLISSHAVEIIDLHNNQQFWLKVNPSE